MGKNDKHIDQLTPEILRAYHAGELTNIQKHEVEKLMLNDAFYTEAWEGIEEFDSKEIEMDLVQLEKQIDKKSNEENTRAFPWYRLVAAAIVIAIVSGIYIYNSKEEPMEDTMELIAPQSTPPSTQMQADQPAIVDKDSTLIDTTLIPAFVPEENLNAGTNSESEDILYEEELEIDLDFDISEEDEIVFESIEEDIAEVDKVEINIPMANFELEIDNIMKNLNPARRITSSPIAAEAKSAIASTSRVVRGRVIGEDDGLPLPQVTVLIKGSSIGVPTDIEGRYTLNINDSMSNTIIFRYLGYLTQEVEIGNQKEINVSMQPDITDVGEVVVAAYGVEREEEKRIGAFARPESGFQTFNRYLKDNIRYPEVHKGSKIKGRVTVLFNVEPDGRITQLRIDRGMGEEFDKEALRLIQDGPDWEPATDEKGDPIVSEMKVRIRFKE